MTAVVLQARIDSTRLYGKALLLLDGKPVVFRVMEALNHVASDLRILACPQDSLSVFTPFAEEAGFEIFAGHKEDVLERYCQAIHKFSLDRVIRATGDNPFVFADAAVALNNEAQAVNADYAGYTELPYGAGVESVAASALLRSKEDTSLPFNREHVCPFLYNNPQIFRIHRPLAPSCWHNPEIRLTVDTQEDYEKAMLLYSALGDTPDRHKGSVIIDTYNNIFSSGYYPKMLFKTTKNR